MGDKSKDSQLKVLYELTHKWKFYQLPYVQELVGLDPGVVHRKGGEYRDLPIRYAIQSCARLDVITWLGEQTGVERMQEYGRGRDGGTTLLHFAVIADHCPAIPYVLAKHMKAATIKDYRGKTAIELAKEEDKNNNYRIQETAIKFLRSPYRVVEEYLADPFKPVEEYSVYHEVLDERKARKEAEQERMQSMISHMHENNSVRWPKTTVEHVTELVRTHPGVLNRSGGIGSKDVNWMKVPLYYAVWQNAPLDVVVWMVEKMGAHRVKEWRGHEGMTFLYYAVFWNHHRLIPYLVYVHPEAVNITNEFGFSPLREATIKKHKEAIAMLSDVKETIRAYSAEHCAAGRR
jgi:hypothetical protein